MPELDDARGWPDAWLLAAVRCDPPHGPALEALAERYRAHLAARCGRLTANAEHARDLAQETWVRVLRARRTLRPDGSFAGFLTTVATNAWRDRQRRARRARRLADDRLASLDAPARGADGDALPVADAVADPETLAIEEQALLRLELDRALGRLPSRSRELLIARYVVGESAAEIGARHGRTEQTVTSWLRQALREIREQLGGAAADVAPGSADAVRPPARVAG